MKSKLATDDLNIILNQSSSFLEQFRNKIIFITGGTGLFGKWLLESFIFIEQSCNLNLKLIVLTRNVQKFQIENSYLTSFSFIEFVSGDILNFEFTKRKIDYIIHAATESSTNLNAEHPDQMIDTIVNGTKRILEYSKLLNVQKILYISSGAVYGRQPEFIAHIPETYMGGPDINQVQSAYSEGKRLAELLCCIHSKNHNISVSIARCFAFCGPYMDVHIHFAIGNFIRDVISKKEILIKGDGTPYRSYLYMADLVVWLWKILFFGQDRTSYNVGSDQEISISELAKLIVKVTQKDIPIQIVQKYKEGTPIERYVPSIERAKTELDLKVYTDLESAIDKMYQWNILQA